LKEAFGDGGRPVTVVDTVRPVAIVDGARPVTIIGTVRHSTVVGPNLSVTGKGRRLHRPPATAVCYLEDTVWRDLT
jgi:hypothetical protein